MNANPQTGSSDNKTPPLKKEAEVYKKNQLLRSALQILVKNLLSQFHARNYDGNKIIRITLQKIKSEPESQEKKDVLDIWPEIQLFIWNLTICPKYWVMMFENEEFFSAESESIDMLVFTSKIYKFVIGEAQRLTNYGLLLGDIISDHLFLFFEEVSSQICQSYQKGREVILSQTKFLQEHVKKSRILNFYFIYKLLLEISQNSFAKIVEDLSTTIFRNIELFYSQSFADYIIQKHEVLSLIVDSNSTKKYSEEEPLIDIMQRIKKSKNIKWRQALREDGESAIIVEFENQNKDLPPESYMIKMDKKGKIKVLNCNTLRRKWMVTEAAEKNYDILNVVSDKGQLAKKLRNSPTKLKDISLTDHFSTVGGALGKCLADIKKYDSVGDFVFDLSKKSILSGTFNYIATNIPLVGVLFATGGYTFTLFSIFRNKNVNTAKKFQQMGYITFDVASSLGTGLIGAVVGQSLIPVPFLGAFIGGFVGSFIGEIGGKAITNKLQSMRFKNIIAKLQATIQPGGYWEVNKQMLKILGLPRDRFYQTIPEQLEGRLGSDKIWFAMIGFTILSFNQSKKRALFLKAKMEQIEKRKDKDQNLQVQTVKQQLHYEPSLDLVCLMKYFEKTNVCLLSCYDQLEQFVTDIFSLIE